FAVEVKGSSVLLVGDNEDVYQLPMAIINPASTRISQLDIGETLELLINGQVLVGVRETEPKKCEVYANRKEET
ncbi:MAG: hypothetical protein ACOC6G_02155, partial [Thermoproteota archaeon]